MISDPAAAAWVAAGRPAVDAPPPVDGRCGRCGEDGPTVTSARIISEKFTGFGLVKMPEGMPAQEFAAYALAANVIINLDEFVTKE